MTISEKLFALKKNPLFAPLEDSDLILIAEVTRIRNFTSGQTVVPSGSPLHRLHVVIEGSVNRKSTGKSAFPVIGIESLLFDDPVSDAFVAGKPEGACCLTLSKGHFFTIINECPVVLTAYLQQAPLSKAPDNEHETTFMS